MKLIKLGKTLIRCLEIIEKHPHITGAAVSRIVEVDCDNIRGYLSRVTRQGLITKHRPFGSMAPTFTVVEGWREKIEDRADIGKPKVKPLKPYNPTKITPLRMGEGRQRPKVLVNSVFALGML
jgi:hypothetical protein